MGNKRSEPYNHTYFLPWEFIDYSKRGGKPKGKRVDSLSWWDEKLGKPEPLQFTKRIPEIYSFLLTKVLINTYYDETNQEYIKNHLKALRKQCLFPAVRLEKTSNLHPLVVDIVLKILVRVVRQEKKLSKLERS